MKSRRSSAELVEQLAEAVVRERPELGQLDGATLSFARMGVVGAEIGRQMAAGPILIRDLPSLNSSEVVKLLPFAGRGAEPLEAPRAFASYRRVHGF